MSYKKAGDVLPQDIVALIQEYIDGEYLYIPRKQENRKEWGESTRIRQELQERNEAIWKAYSQGSSIEELSDMFFLSEKSIQRIILQLKKQGVEIC